MLIVLSIFESNTVGDNAIYLKFITHTCATQMCAAVVSCLPEISSALVQ